MRCTCGKILFPFLQLEACGSTSFCLQSIIWSLLVQVQALEGLGQENSKLAASNETLAKQLSGSASLSVSLNQSALCWRGDQDSHIVLIQTLNSALYHVYVGHCTPSTLKKVGMYWARPCWCLEDRTNRPCILEEASSCDQILPTRAVPIDLSRITRFTLSGGHVKGKSAPVSCFVPQQNVLDVL